MRNPVRYYILRVLAVFNASVNHHGQYETGSLRRWVALVCIALIVLLAAVEATHAHSDVATVRSSPCAICLTVHGNAPALTYHVLPTLSALETLTAPSLPQRRAILQTTSLFIRPPPTV